MLYGFRFTRLKPANTGHIDVPCRKQSVVNIPINRFFADIKLVGFMRDDMVYGLPSLDERIDELVKCEEGFFGDINTCSGFN